MKVSELAIYALLIFVVLTWFFPRDKIDLETEIKLHDITQDGNLKQKQINQYEFQIRKFKNEFKKDSIIIDNYDSLQVDSFFAVYFNKRTV